MIHVSGILLSDITNFAPQKEKSNEKLWALNLAFFNVPNLNHFEVPLRGGIYLPVLTLLL